MTSIPRTLALLALASCTSSTPEVNASSYPASALQTVMSASGALSITVRTTPNQPPVAGPAAAQFVVTDAVTGTPATGLVVTVVPWMPAMGHGQSATTSVTETPALSGIYVVTNLDFIMSGEWELKTTFTGSDDGGSAFSDTANPEFNVQ